MKAVNQKKLLLLAVNNQVGSVSAKEGVASSRHAYNGVVAVTDKVGKSTSQNSGLVHKESHQTAVQLFQANPQDQVEDAVETDMCNAYMSVLV